MNDSDPDGLAASAVVRMPGTEITRPTLDTRALPIKVTAGVTKEIALNDYIVTRAGRSVQLTGDSKVSTGLGWDGSTCARSNTKSHQSRAGALVEVADEAVFSRASEEVDAGFGGASRFPVFVADSGDVGVDGVFGDAEGTRHGG